MQHGSNLFNLYACVVGERWLSRVAEMEDISCVTKSLGLTVNIIKSKFMFVGHDIAEEDIHPISLERGEIEHVSEFPYLRSSIAENGRIDDEIDK